MRSIGRRRAEDDPRWRKHINENIDWKGSFSSLGCAFTVRILLRRELFSVLEDWLINDGNLQGESAQTIIDDIETTLNGMTPSTDSGIDTSDHRGHASTDEKAFDEGRKTLQHCLKNLRERYSA